MDSFDIDKLLDELELNEGNKTTATTPPAASSNNNQILKPDQLNELKFTNSFNAIQNVETTKNSSSSSFKNVFSSLNDYVNAGIETTKPIAESNNSDATHSGNDNGHGSKYFDKQVESDEEKSCLLNDDREHEDVSDDSGSGGRLPIEDRRPDFNSSSSASSSPTSGHSTSSIPSSTEIEYENQTFDNNTHSFSEFSEKPPPLAEAVEMDSTPLDLGPPVANNDIPQSTISDTFSTETINLEEISSLSSIVEITSNYNNVRVGSTMDERDESLRPAGQYMAVNPIDSQDLNPDHQPDTASRRQVVGFESTMDDVSDTELESYLQDLEYEVSEKQDIALKSTECENVISKLATDANRSVDVVEEDDQLSQASTVEVNDSKLHEIEGPVPQQPDLENNPDAVEQQSPSVLLEEKACSSIKQLNVVKTEAVLVDAIDIRPEVAAQEPEEVVVAQESQEQKISSSDEALEKEVSENEDEVNANNPVIEEATTKQPLQRPNSLDLNSSNNAADTNQPQASPGHTPPSTAHPPMDSETTSSSEDFSASIAIPEEANEGSGGGGGALEVSDLLNFFLLSIVLSLNFYWDYLRHHSQFGSPFQDKPF
jgi:hypothetical protein